MTQRPTDEPKAMAAAEGQPTSTMSRLHAGVVDDRMRDVAQVRPHQPDDEIDADEGDADHDAGAKGRPGFGAQDEADAKMTIGSNTVAPSPSTTAFRATRIPSISISPMRLARVSLASASHRLIVAPPFGRFAPARLRLSLDHRHSRRPRSPANALHICSDREQLDASAIFWFDQVCKLWPFVRCCDMSGFRQVRLVPGPGAS